MVKGKVKPDGHIYSYSSMDVFAFRFMAIGPFLAENFCIWPWKSKVKVTTKIDQYLIR